MTISTEDPRDIKALAAVQNFGQWAKVRDSTGRELAYGIPSATKPGVYHFANASECTCKDFEYGHRCYHSRAVAMHVALTSRPRVTRIHHTLRED